MEKAMPAPPKVVAIAAAPPVKGGPTFTDRAADKSSNFREDGHFYPLSVVLSAAVDRSNKQRMSSAYTRNAYLRINLGWSLGGRQLSFSPSSPALEAATLRAQYPAAVIWVFSPHLSGTLTRWLAFPWELTTA